MTPSKLRVVTVRLAAAFFYYSGVVAISRWRMARQGRILIILNYHRAADSDLGSHLRYLRRHYRIVPLESALCELYGATQWHSKDKRTRLAVTFDDGYHDNYTLAAPLACALQIPLTIFLIPGYAESGQRFWWYEGEYLACTSAERTFVLDGRTYYLGESEDRKALTRAIYQEAYRATSVSQREAFLDSVRATASISPLPPADDPRRPLTWSEIKEMETLGWVSFGAHTLHHPVLGNLADREEVRREVQESRVQLEQRLGHPVRTFAYPLGQAEHIGANALQAVRDAGYSWAVTTERGLNTPQTDPHLLQRIVIGTDLHWQVLAMDITGVWQAVTRVRRAVQQCRPISWIKATMSRSREESSLQSQPPLEPQSEQAARTVGNRTGTFEGVYQPQDSKNESAAVSAEGWDNYVTLVRNLVRSSSIYALASLASPLITLVLAPFLTHRLSPTDYGALSVLLTVIALVAGVTQFGLGSAFFRAYGYDYDAPRDRLAVVSTSISMLALVTIPVTAVAVVAAPWIAALLLGTSVYADAIMCAALVLLFQNLTVPGLAWLRVENRAGTYSTLAFANLLVSLCGAVLFVGVFQLGIVGALMGTMCGYATVDMFTLPKALRHAGLHLKAEVARNLLSFGLPLMLSVVAVWVLQLSDRYLLSRLGSLELTAGYAVAYSIGGVVSVVLILPFMLAWPAVQFAIAKREDAHLLFRQLFRWYTLVLVGGAYGLILAGTVVLTLLFPITYRPAMPIIPVVGASLVFYGISTLLGVGIGIQRKTWLAVVSLSLAAAVNLGVNLVLIPHFGGMGAALSTLIAYVVLAGGTWTVNHWIYPVPYQIGRFLLAVASGALCFTGYFRLTANMGGPTRLAVGLLSWLLFGTWLIVLMLGRRSLSKANFLKLKRLAVYEARQLLAHLTPFPARPQWSKFGRGIPR